MSIFLIIILIYLGIFWFATSVGTLMYVTEAFEDFFVASGPILFSIIIIHLVFLFLVLGPIPFIGHLIYKKIRG